MATNPKQQANLAKIEAQRLLDTNNSAASHTSDQLLSVLEAGKGSSITRDVLDQYLHNYVEHTIGDPNRRSSLNYDRATLRKFLSIKEKVAYVTGLVYADTEDQVHGTPLTSTDNIVDKRLRDTLEGLVSDIERGLLHNMDFNESRAIRNAAVNRFECKLSTSETSKLNDFTLQVRSICAINNIDTLVESTHFTHESDAQKILKLSDILIQLSAMGIKLDDKTLQAFEPLDEKVKPLKNLDKHYKHVTKTLNMLHRVAQKGYHAMIRPPQQKKLDNVLEKLNMIKTVNDELNNFNKIENFDKNDEHGFLENLIGKITAHPDFEKTIYAMSISPAQFNERFYSSCAYTLVNAAKYGLHTQKGVVFGDRLALFEADTQSRRGLVRRRLFEIADRMGPGADFATTQDADTANSYFDKFRDLFFAKEEDNYLGADRAGQLHYHKMEKVISAIVRRRVPALASTHRIRTGSGGRILFKFIEYALKGKDRGLYQAIRRMRHRANDASIVAMVIMAQNEATNQVFYQDQDKTQKADNRWGKLWHKVSCTERGRSAIKDRIAPAANKALAFTEEAAKKGLQLSKGVAKVGNKVVSKTVRGASWLIGTRAGKFNTMIKKGGYKRWKTPLYLPYMLTAPTESGMKYVYQGATYTDRMGNKHLDELGNTVNKGYEEAKHLVSTATGEETKYLFQGLTYATEEVTKLAGKTVSAGGQRMYDSYTVGQQRSILGAFYNAAKEDKGMADLMQTSEMADLLNFKARGPRIFDEDGRIVTTDIIKERYTEDKDGEKNIKKDVLGKKHDEIQKQFNDYVEAMAKKYEALDAKLDEHTRGTPEYDTVAKQIASISISIDTLNDEKTTINDILLVIQNGATGAITDEVFHTEIKKRVIAIGTKLAAGEKLVDDSDPLHLGFKQQIEAKNREINEKKVELKRIEDKLATRVHEGDLSSGELRDERLALQGEIGVHKADIRVKQKESLEKQGEVSAIKNKNSQLDGYITEGKRKQKNLDDQKATRVSLNSDLTTKNADLADPATPAASKPAIQKEINELKKKLSKISEVNFGAASNLAEIDEFIAKQLKNITDDEDELNANKIKITTLDGEIDILNGEVDEAKDLVRTKTAKIDEIDKKLSAKGPADKSRVDSQAEKATIEQDIVTLEAEKGELNKKMAKQDEKNKVYRKIHRRGKKIENLTKTIVDIHKNASLDDKEKAKISIKTIKDCDIDFDVKTTPTGNKSRKDRSEEEKKEMMDAFKKEKETSPTPTTPAV